MTSRGQTSTLGTFTTLVVFNGSNGYEPEPLVQGTDGNLYGTTLQGGGTTACSEGCGTIFKVTPTGNLTTLYRFCANQNCTDGDNPLAGLTLGTDGDFYGTTYGGGAIGWGTVFKISREGTLTTLHSFAGYPDDGGLPSAPLVQATDGNFYGTTYEGGSSLVCQFGCGTVFKITPGGTLTTLHAFDGTDGSLPAAGLVQGIDGSLYGTTDSGGVNSVGTVFRITSPGNTLVTLHSFEDVDGAIPAGALVQAGSGNFYGTATSGGLDAKLCAIGSNASCGTVFKITSGGTLTTVHRFDGADGGHPDGLLVQATDGSLYGSTLAGGADGSGTIFKMTSGGAITTLHPFSGNDGFLAAGGLVQATNGTFYGVTLEGGTSNSCLGGCGTIFSESVGLSPFVTTLPTSRAIGQRVAILGNNLTGTTSVTFNGTPAAFAVVSSTEISTTVPTGATTGPVQVVTPSGTLTSNVPFSVIP
ncbi:MAG TPA: choice-of-anchor tandem repeat GloVer-containing protein [Terriglobia bacterium]|nr:choice-of-anchor tandem repeat GloVer-containing protein [Terriglobia bacterium]